MNLAHLLADIFPLSLPHEIEVADLTLDSRLVKPDTLFFALTGTHQDGRQFIADAIQKNACAVLSENSEYRLDWQDQVPVMGVPDLRNLAGQLAAKFYDYPARKMQMVGVTGTSGKTSCTQFIAEALAILKKSCGVIGTLGNGLYGAITPGDLTTPDAITLQKTLATLLAQGAEITAMEVSSHSLDQGRVNGIAFDIGIFTNLSRDHLDYHHTMENYGAAKKRLFDQTRVAVINADDDFGQVLLREFAGRENIFSYGMKNADVFAENIQLDESGIRARVVTPWGTGHLDSRLVGQFNLQNVLAVITTLCLLEIPFASVMEAVSQLHPVAGRMQLFGGKSKPQVVVDYAHKPDALEKVLLALRPSCQGKLYCIFGCGGERDRGKRPIMATIAEHYADQIIVTDDNPRHEDPAQIVQDILAGFSDKSRVTVEHDRSRAIHDTIQFARAGDCVLIAGKGAETYQLVGDLKLPFSDTDQVIAALKN